MDDYGNCVETVAELKRELSKAQEALRESVAWRQDVATALNALPITQIDAETLARKFHDVYEGFAPKFGYETRPETRQFDPASNNGRLMIAVCFYLLDFLRGEQKAVQP